MQRAQRILRKDSFDPTLASDSIALDFDGRHRRRLVLSTEKKRYILLDLPVTAHMRDGDALSLGEGSLVVVTAKAESLLEITAPPDLLMRIGWHLGNRHLPTQFLNSALRIRTDHVIADMVRTLGGRIAPVAAPFDPESGAYSHGEAGGGGKGGISHG